MIHNAGQTKIVILGFLGVNSKWLPNEPHGTLCGNGNVKNIKLETIRNKINQVSLNFPGGAWEPLLPTRLNTFAGHGRKIPNHPLPLSTTYSGYDTGWTDPPCMPGADREGLWDGSHGLRMT